MNFDPRCFGILFHRRSAVVRLYMLLCFLIVGIHASGISIPLSLLMPVVRVKCPMLLACSETTEVWVRANRMSCSCSLILSRIGLVSPMKNLQF